MDLGVDQTPGMRVALTVVHVIVSTWDLEECYIRL